MRRSVDAKLHDLFRIKPSSAWWVDTLRLSAPVVLALIGFSLAGMEFEGLLVALGAYIVLFGAGQPARQRSLTLVLAAGLMLGAISLGVLVAPSFWLTLLAYLGVALLAAIASVTIYLGPPGPYFFVLMVGGGTLLGASGVPLANLLPYLALGNGLAAFFGMADLAFDRYRPERQAIAAATAAVAAMRTDVEATPPGSRGHDVRAKLSQSLSTAAAAISKAWGTSLSGTYGATNDTAAQLQTSLVQLQKEYQQLYLRAVGLVPARETVDGALVSSRIDLPQSFRDARFTAFGAPALGYRMAESLNWPSGTLISLARMALALILVNLAIYFTGSTHPFWAVLVVVLLLSFPGDQSQLRWRGLQRFVGTVLGIAVFLPLAQFHPPEAASVVVLCVIFYGISEFSTRNYMVGSALITVFALMLTVPLSPAETAGQLAFSRLTDTLIALVAALIAIQLIGSRFADALALRSARRIARATAAVLAHVERHDDFLNPAFVEQRRRLQWSLFLAGSARHFDNPNTANRTSAFISLEQACASAGLWALGVTWTNPGDVDKSAVGAMRDRLAAVATITVAAPHDAGTLSEVLVATDD